MDDEKELVGLSDFDGVTWKDAYDLKVRLMQKEKDMERRRHERAAHDRVLENEFTSYLNTLPTDVLVTMIRNGLSISKLKYPTEEMQLAAVHKSRYAITDIPDPTPLVRKVHNMMWEI